MDTTMGGRIRVLVAVLILAVALGACRQSTGATVTLVESDSGRTVELVRGDKLILQLEAAPTTGYTWEVIWLDTSILKQLGDPEQKQGQPGMMGGGVTLVFTFQAVGKGQMDLKMVYHQPWDKDTPPEKAMDVTVMVE